MGGGGAQPSCLCKDEIAVMSSGQMQQVENEAHNRLMQGGRRATMFPPSHWDQKNLCPKPTVLS